MRYASHPRDRSPQANPQSRETRKSLLTGHGFPMGGTWQWVLGGRFHRHQGPMPFAPSRLSQEFIDGGAVQPEGLSDPPARHSPPDYVGAGSDLGVLPHGPLPSLVCDL